MFAIRRTALRAVLATAKPSPSVILPKTRTFVSLNQSKLRSAKQWASMPMQRRYASDDAASTEGQLKKRVEAQEASEGSPAVEDVAVEEAAVKAASGSPAAVVEEVVTEPAVSETQDSMETTSSVNGATATGAASGFAAANAPSSPSAAARQAPNQVAANKTLYIGNIFFEVTDQALEDYFARFGPIQSTKIIHDARGLSKGFGYVEFQNIDDATKAVDAANQQVFQGRRLAVQFHRPRVPVNRHKNPAGVNPPSKTLFIGNMSFEMSDKDLSDLFREVRNVIDVRIAIDRRTGQPRGFAHADFIDVNSAMKAMEYLKGKELYGRQLRVDYSLSTPRSPPA